MPAQGLSACVRVRVRGACRGRRAGGRGGGGGGGGDSVPALPARSAARSLPGTERADLACARRPAQPSPAPARRREPRCRPRPRPCRRRAREREPESPPPERSRAHAEPARRRHGHHGDLHPPTDEYQLYVRILASKSCGACGPSRDPGVARAPRVVILATQTFCAAGSGRTAAPRPGCSRPGPGAHGPARLRPPSPGLGPPDSGACGLTGPVRHDRRTGGPARGAGLGAAGAAAGVPGAPGRRDAFGGGRSERSRARFRPRA